MSIEGGPWGRRTPGPEEAAKPPSPPSRLRSVSRQIAWPLVLLMAGIAGLVLALSRAFPETRFSGQDWTATVYLAGFALVVATGLWRMRRIRPVRLLRHGALWVAIAAVLALGFAYREEIELIPQRLGVAFGTGRPVVIGDHQLVISQDADGAYQVVGRVNGEPVRFMVDTGASDTVLTPQDAQRLGVDLAGVTFDQESETANGKGLGAPYLARQLEVGPIRLGSFRMQINKAPMSRSLLGLSFLSRLESYEFRGRNLYLKWRG